MNENRGQFKKLTHCKRGHELTPSNVYQYGASRVCKLCTSIRGKDERYADRRRESGRRYFQANKFKKYGLSRRDVSAMMVAQCCRCLICKIDFEVDEERRSPRDWPVVDHCHATGKVRGLLCGFCNSAIGYLREEPGNAVRAARYLAVHTGRR